MFLTHHLTEGLRFAPSSLTQIAPLRSATSQTRETLSAKTLEINVKDARKKK